MEKKINLVEILKDCPKGMELDCTMYDDVRFICVTECKTFPIIIERADSGRITLTQYGECTSMNTAKCVIFPKGKTTWEGFVPPCQFKDGDILKSGNGSIFIYKKSDVDGFGCYCGFDTVGVFVVSSGRCWTSYVTGFATEEEKQKLFDAIKENGYKWNAETKTLEKLIEPIFKVGDKICRNGIIFEISQINKECYTCHTDESLVTIDFKHQDKYELVPSKFDISTLKPFESRVLARIDNYNLWKPTIFGFWDEDGAYMVGGSFWRQVIPYEGNEKLLGTTDDCDEYYKTWE